MTNYFVDSTTGSDSDNGTTMDLAWASYVHAVTAGGLVAGDYVWIRRIHDESVGGTVNVAYSGESDNAIKVIGWPRPTLDITSATWTNGSRTVSLVVGVSMAETSHIARYVTAPDGERYMTSYITDSATFKLDTPYNGATVTLTDGAATIYADDEWYDDMGTQYGFDDSGWTIKESAWDADAHAMPKISLFGGSYYIYHYSDRWWYYANIYFDGGSWSSGSFYFRQGATTTLRGVYLKNDSNGGLLLASGTVLYLKRVVCRGTNEGGNYGLSAGGSVYVVDDVVLDGIRYCLSFTQNGGIRGRGLHLGLNIACAIHYNIAECNSLSYIKGLTEGTPTAQFVNYDRIGYYSLGLEDYQGVLGAHKVYNNFGTIIKLDVVAGSGDPEKRSKGADSVLELLYDWDEADCPTHYEYGGAVEALLDHEIEATTDSKSYRYYVQSEVSLTADDLWLEVEYAKGYTDTSTHKSVVVQSDETITVRDDASDWTQYIEVTGIQPAVASKVRLRMYCKYYHATNKVYIDPLVVIS
jgi:hypothetical protein